VIAGAGTSQHSLAYLGITYGTSISQCAIGCAKLFLLFDAIDMVFTCKDCGIEFLSSSEFELHKQTHLDKWSSKPDRINWKAPDGLNPALYKVFEKYCLDGRAKLCL
jgi:hypothetical protein